MASARPNAGALFFLSVTQSEMYANVRGKVALQWKKIKSFLEYCELMKEFAVEDEYRIQNTNRNIKYRTRIQMRNK